jgi:hypothetical protein
VAEIQARLHIVAAQESDDFLDEPLSRLAQWFGV